MTKVEKDGCACAKHGCDEKECKCFCHEEVIGSESDPKIDRESIKGEAELPFVAQNMQKYHKPEEGVCTCCRLKGMVCEHSHCKVCLCKHYCWVD